MSNTVFFVSRPGVSFPLKPLPLKKKKYCLDTPDPQDYAVLRLERVLRMGEEERGGMGILSAKVAAVNLTI